ncbi:hypothetical protein [Kitasatospora sp. NPDC048538]|uniref:hypothetical protein n=1 Tax=unclassified Kitasatospora TaxID=2633591 RepID=UPI003405DC5D
MGRETVPHREMTLGADVPCGPRRRERLLDINDPAGRVGLNDPNATASTDDMTDDQDRRLPPEISMSIPSEHHTRASNLHVRRWRRLIPDQRQARPDELR